jgi:hypothetical protein
VIGKMLRRSLTVRGVVAHAAKLRRLNALLSVS